MKYKRYLRLKKKILAGAAGGVMASMLLLGSGTAYAEVSDVTLPRTEKTAPMHVLRHVNSHSKAGSLARKFGLDRRSVRNELKSGKTFKQILQENGIDTTELPNMMHD